jgi:hypothetical protein
LDSFLRNEPNWLDTIGLDRLLGELRQTLSRERFRLLQIPDQNQPLMLELTFLAHCQCGEKLAQKQG